MTSPCEILVPETRREGQPRDGRPDRCRAFVEVYPEEVLLRVRVDGRTAILERLTPAEAAYARGSPAGLSAVAVAHLEAAGLAAALGLRAEGPV